MGVEQIGWQIDVGIRWLLVHPRTMPLARKLLVSMLAIVVMISGCSKPTAHPPFRIEVRGQASRCTIYVAGRQVSNEEFLRLARMEVHKAPSAYIDADVQKTPFRCFGGALFKLQQVGFKRIGWPVEPPDKHD